MWSNPTPTRTTHTAPTATPSWAQTREAITEQPWATILAYVIMPPDVSSSRSAQRIFGQEATRPVLRAVHFPRPVNPYPEHSRNNPRNEVVRVPAAYACQYLSVCPSVNCPFFYHHERLTLSCLYISDIEGGPLRVSNNWLLSFFERYPGFRELELTPSCTGAIVRFQSDYHTAFVKLSLDGFWPNSRHMLKLTLVDSSINGYIYLPGFNPEHFFLSV